MKLKFTIPILFTLLASIGCEKNDKAITAESISLNHQTLSITAGKSEVLVATVKPDNAINKELQWSSSGATIATVDQTGTVTALSPGEVIITTTIFGSNLSAQCNITVTRDLSYIDKNGVNHGSGVEINGLIWAPVNCGYNAQTRPYGELYQWGRIDGQGYEGEENEPSVRQGPISDAPSENTFYTQVGGYYNWLMEPDDTLWGIPKTEYDPCPKGWRLPSNQEFSTLGMGLENSTVVAAGNPALSLHGQAGRWFGKNHATASVEDNKGCVFLPYAGGRLHNNNTFARTTQGFYWTNEVIQSSAYCMIMYTTPDANNVLMFFKWRADGLAVRCIAE